MATGHRYLPLTITPGKTGRPNAIKLPRQTMVAERTAKGVASPSFSGSTKEGRGKAQYYLQWDDAAADDFKIYQCLLDFCGYSFTVFANDHITPIGIQRVIPYPHPKNPDYIYAENVESIDPDVPLGKDIQNVALYDEARIAVQFAQKPYKVLDDGVFSDPSVPGNFFGEYLCQQYVSIRVETLTRYERIPAATAMRFGGFLAPVGALSQPVFSLSPTLQAGQYFRPTFAPAPPPWQNFPVVIQFGAVDPAIATPVVSNSMVVQWTEAEVYVTWYQIPFDGIPWAAISNCTNKVEANNPKSPFFNFLSNTYLGPILQPPRVGGTSINATGTGRTIPQFVCLNPSYSDPYQMPTGDFAIDIKYRFHFYPYGAGYFFNWNTGTFQPGINARTGKAFFQEANFNNLFWSS